MNRYIDSVFLASGGFFVGNLFNGIWMNYNRNVGDQTILERFPTDARNLGAYFAFSAVKSLCYGVIWPLVLYDAKQKYDKGVLIGHFSQTSAKKDKGLVDCTERVYGWRAAIIHLYPCVTQYQEIDYSEIKYYKLEALN